MVTHTPRDGVGWGKEIGQCSELQNVSFSRDRKLMLTKLASLMYLWMKDILMVTHTPRGGMEK